MVKDSASITSRQQAVRDGHRFVRMTELVFLFSNNPTFRDPSGM